MAGVIWTVGAALALTDQLRHGGRWSDEAVWTSITIVGAGYALLARFWPAASTGPQRRAVAQVRVGRTVVGSAFRTRGRFVVTSTDVVNEALGRSPREGAMPPERIRIELRFMSGPGPGDDVCTSARVVEWGPARNDLLNNKAVVLRTVERLPRRIPSLRIAGRTYEGPASIVLPQEARPDGGDRGTLTAEVNDHHLFVSPAPTDPPPAGAPVLSVDPDDPTLSGEVVALFSADHAGDPKALDGNGSGLLPRLVEADDMRALVHTISRRDLLRIAAATGGVAALGGAGLLLTSGSRLTPLRGAGWRELFMNDAVRAYLKDQRFLLDDSFAKLSGVETLNLGSRLFQYDFITAPNEVVANLLTEDGPFAGASPEQLCAEEMVIVASRSVAEGLSRYGGLVLPNDGKVSFDIRHYLENYERGRTWKGIGASDQGRFEGLVKVAGSDPLRAGGGQLFLWLLAQVSAQAGLGEPDWLWKSGGPLYRLARSGTDDLFTDLTSGSQKMVFVYEHDAIDFLMKPHQNQSFVMLRTHPKISLNQQLVTTNSQFADLFSELEPEFAKILVREFHIRVPGHEAEIDDLLRIELSNEVWAGTARALDADRPQVDVNLRDVRILMGRMKKYMTRGVV